jgi:hypothetical protein
LSQEFAQCIPGFMVWKRHIDPSQSFKIPQG